MEASREVFWNIQFGEIIYILAVISVIVFIYAFYRRYKLWRMGKPENRQAMWNWSRDNLDAVLDRIPSWRKGQLPRYFSTFCSSEAADQVESLFKPIIDNLESGTRYLANSLETIRLCAAFADIHRSEAEPLQ